MLTGTWGLSRSCGATATAAVDVADVAIVRRERRSRRLCLAQVVQPAKPVRPGFQTPFNAARFTTEFLDFASRRSE